MIKRVQTAMLIAAALASALGCGSPNSGSESPSSQEASVVHGHVFEDGLFVGTLPCASCPGIETRVEFRDDVYLRQRVYKDGSDAGDRVFWDLGRWNANPNGRLVLRSDRGEVTRFAVVDSDRIRLLDQSGMPIDTEANLVLEARSGGLDEFGPTPLSGMYTYFADAAIFEPCNTEARFPVAMVEQHVDLERAYLANRAAPGAPLMVEFVGRLEKVSAMEGDGVEEAIVVTEFGQAHPEKSCLGEDVLTDSLEWFLREMNGVPIVRDDPAMLPAVSFGVDRITGSTGCNRMTGPFELADGEFRLGPLAMTRRACPDTLEAAFVAFLENVESHHRFGDELELVSSDGAIALFSRSVD